MSDIIRLLPDSVANQIAAGEVIQRPASVVKELVENSVDAGATDIKIFIKDAGRTLIQVVDNGKGMSQTDARMAFERHATSKIKDASDLFQLNTMGFRGEALPSICAVSQVEIKTKPMDETIGTRLLINATKVEQQDPVACESGTSLMVKNLFFNVPARRKFLKSDNVELSNIMREFERLALVNNNIRMSIDTGNRSIDLRPATFKQRIADLWKNNLDLHLVPINVDTSLIKITGYVSRPEFARRRNPLQYLIVNGRNMKHPYFHKAIVGCYDSLIAADTQPCYFIKFEVDPSSIDVNIHPTKNEIKFEYEQQIWPIIQASVKAALGKFGAVPSIDFNLEEIPVVPLKKGETVVQPRLDMPHNYNPFSSTTESSNSKHPYVESSQAYHKRDARQVKNWDSLYDKFMNQTKGNSQNQDDFKSESSEIHKKNILPEFTELPEVGAFCVQHSNRFIVTSSHDGIMIIDQRRAHVKILYEKYLSKVKSGEQVSQSVMFPDSIEIDHAQQDALEEMKPELIRLGFNLEYEEGIRWRIIGVPAMIKNSDARDIVLRILDSIDDSGINYGNDHAGTVPMIERMALIMARAAAIPKEKKLTDDEMEHIVSELFALEDPSYTPDGKKIFQMIDNNYLDSTFK